MTPLEKLVALGYTTDEAEIVLHVAQTAHADRANALRTGLCACGGRLVRLRTSVECVACDAVHAA